MITRFKFKRGEGVLEEPNSQIGSRRSQNPKTPPLMAHEEGKKLMYVNERDFRKAFYDMSEMM